MNNRFMLTYSKYIIWSLLIILVYSCAAVVSPTGGPRDIASPVIKKTEPAFKSTNFNSRTIKIDFDEFVTAPNVSEQLIVCPTLKHQPDVKIKGKSMIVTINDTLLPATTYSFNFQESIKDITEGNTLSNYKYVLSTGSFVDSAMLSGAVINAFDNSVVDKASVLLYKNDLDSLAIKMTPVYIEKTKSDGSFKFTNLKDTSYILVVVKEETPNFLFDLPNEKVGFSSKRINVVLGDSIKAEPLNISLFNESPSKQYINKKSYTFGRLVLPLNKPIKSFNIMDIRNPKYSKSFRTELSSKGDTINCWLPEAEIDSMFLKVSTDNDYTDTLEMKYVPRVQKTQVRSGRGKAPEIKFGYTANINKSTPHTPNQPIILTFSYPIDSIRLDSIAINEDDKLINIRPSFIDSVHRKLQFLYNWKQSKKYGIIIPPSSIVDMFGLKNDTITLEMLPRELEYYGTIKLSATVKDSMSYILQLKDEKGNTILENIVNTDTLISYQYLAPGQYKLKAIADRNNNGKWDTGNYVKRIQPEETFLYKENIIVRSNWDVEVKWELESSK